MKRLSKRSRGVLTVIGVLVSWFGCLHGEYRSSHYADGMRYTSTQYLLGITLWQTKGSDPPGLSVNPPDPSAVLGEARSWRGFGFVIKWRRYYR